MSKTDFLKKLSNIVEPKNLLLGERETEHYRSGFRSGSGQALAVVFPTTLLQQWQVLKACVEADKIIIMQAANTGLTEGSTPNNGDYERGIVIINTTRIDDIFLLDEGKQVVALSGATLFKLEKILKPLNREPHSVIGSSCIGASIIGGIANNSGGSLVKRGPAYTEFSLFAQLDTQGQLTLVNHLGVELGHSPEEMLERLQSGDFEKKGVSACCQGRKASSVDYEKVVRDVEADTPARYNADPAHLYEASGCAGKLAVFAVRVDTFHEPECKKVFYVGTNETKAFTWLRKSILNDCKHLPDSAEYIHRDAYNIAHKYGKDTLAMIDFLGTDPLPKLFAAKGAITSFLNKISFLPKDLPDLFMQMCSKLMPELLPKKMQQFQRKFEHHLILEISDDAIQEATKVLNGFKKKFSDVDYFVCDDKEAKKAKLHRFAVASAAVRYESCHKKKVGGILALDIALRRNDESWFETLPTEISEQIDCAIYYGHFMCHVMHQDYIVKKGVDMTQLKKAMLTLLDERGAKYPAEHNVGHLYDAEPQLKTFYNTLDPSNSFNPGIGKTSKNRNNQ